MQKIATRIFMYASVVFGLLGITLALFGADDDNDPFNAMMLKLIMITIFIILPSFALSIASKYLNGKS